MQPGRQSFTRRRESTESAYQNYESNTSFNHVNSSYKHASISHVATDSRNVSNPAKYNNFKIDGPESQDISSTAAQVKPNNSKRSAVDVLSLFGDLEESQSQENESSGEYSSYENGLSSRTNNTSDENNRKTIHFQSTFHQVKPMTHNRLFDTVPVKKRGSDFESEPGFDQRLIEGVDNDFGEEKQSNCQSPFLKNIGNNNKPEIENFFSDDNEDYDKLFGNATTASVIDNDDAISKSHVFDVRN